MISQLISPIIFAHRGASGYKPENTIAAFQLALAQGADGLESDTFLSLDGTPMLVHDGVVERDGRRIDIRLTKAEALRALGIPTLADFYRECGSDFQFSLDLQHMEAAWPTLQTALRAGAVERLWLCHASLDLLTTLRAESPQVKLVQSIDRKYIKGRLAEHARRLAELGVDVLNMRWFDWTPRLVREVQAQGIKAFAWDVHTPAVMEHAVTLGADALYTNYPDQLVSVIKNTRPQGGGRVEGRASPRG